MTRLSNTLSLSKHYLLVSFYLNIYSMLYIALVSCKPMVLSKVIEIMDTLMVNTVPVNGKGSCEAVTNVACCFQRLCWAVCREHQLKL